MANDKDIRSWMDVHYRESLSAAERASLASNPAGELDLDELELELVAGGNTWKAPTGSCPMGTGGCSCDQCKKPKKLLGSSSSASGSSSGF